MEISPATRSESSPPPVVAPATAEPWSMTHIPSHIRLWSVTLIGLAIDLWTKHWAFDTLEADEPKKLLDGVLTLQLSLNPGALFGIGAGFAPLFVGASVMALLFVLYLFANAGVRRKSMHIALGLVLGGALGNLYDRATQEAYVAYTPNGRDIGVLVRETSTHAFLADFPDGGNERAVRKSADRQSGPQPVVRDFIKIDVRAGSVPLWPWIFNIADALLVFGVAILLLNFWSERKIPQDPAARAEAPTSA